MKDSNGNWIGWGLGDVDPKVSDIKAFLKRKFSYASVLDNSPTYDQATVSVVQEMQRRYGLPVTGIFDYASQVKSGYYKPPAPPIKPIMFTVEGHTSDMFAGPVADTAAQLEAEGLLHHQPIGYNNGAIPFDNASGVNELARLLGQGKMDNGVPFPLGTKFVIGGFSQGMIVVTDFIAQFLQTSQVHEARAADCLGVLAYGNPCRNTGSVAPWSIAQAGPRENSGLDPLLRLDKLGIKPSFPIMDVYRKGDIFADNEPTKKGEVKAAVYQAVARGDVFSNPYSILAQIADLFTVPFDEVWAMFLAIIDGITFLAHQQDSPHYSPFDITGGKNWVRKLVS